MGRCRMVKPEVVRLLLSDGDFLDVKKTLNAGEYRHLIISQRDVKADGEIRLDLEKVQIAKLLAYILGWSLIGLDDKPIPYSYDMPEAQRIAAINGLDQDTYRELVQAVDAHEAQDEQERSARKNAQGGEKRSPTISPSPVPAVGAMSGLPS